MDDIKVSVIIPVYKVEKFIERCAESLLDQTLKGVEYIFVNDATPDNSIAKLEDVLKKYPERNETVKILHHKSNRGLPTARNTGLAQATGEYIFHCDSDDYVDSKMLETMYSTAKNDDLDIVWCDWYLSFDRKERYMKQPEYDTPLEALKGMMSGAMKFNVWNKLAKRALYTDYQISFPDGNGMGEDMTMMMLFALAQRVKYIPEAFYHYVKTNVNAFSCTYSDQHLIELSNNVSRIENFIRQRYGESLDKEISYMKLEAKFPFLLSNDNATTKLWKRWYPEANGDIKTNHYISSRNRGLQLLAARNQFWMIKLYRCILNIYYSIIYKR
jgi:glycosyltransferase involved in cell wall biosynthesis